MTLQVSEIESKLPNPPRGLPDYLRAPESFKLAYSKFCEELVASPAPTIDVQETKSHIYVIIVGVVRIYVNKASGTIRTQKFDFRSKTWRIDLKFGAISPLRSVAGWNFLVSYALQHRLQYLSAHTLEDFVEYPRALLDIVNKKEDLYEWAIQFAVRRRLGGGPRKLMNAALLARCFWGKLMTPDVSRLALAYFGRQFNLDGYHFCLKHRHELKQLQMETPQLVPLMGGYLSAPSNLGLIRFKEGVPLNLVAQIKQKLINVGLTEAGWRHIAGYSASTVRAFTSLLQHLYRGKDWPGYKGDVRGYGFRQLNHAGVNVCVPSAIFIANLLSSANILNGNALHSLKVWMYRKAGYIGGFVNNLGVRDAICFQRLLRLAEQEATIQKGHGCLKRFIQNELQQSLDWALNGDVFPNCKYLNKKSSWKTVTRLQRQWHLELTEQRMLQALKNEETRLAMLKADWHAGADDEVNGLVIQGITITPLTSGQKLLDEAIEMSHCVDQYVNNCLNGHCRIFRLTAEGGERATLELSPKTAATWRVAQLQGYDNTDVSKAMMTVAKRVSSQYSQASRRH